MDWATKDNFFKAKAPVEEMEVPTIGRVKVHGLGLGEKEEWEKSSFKVNVEKEDLTLSNADIQLLILTVHNQHGARMFSDKDMGRLRMLPAVYARPVLDTAYRLSGIGKNAVKDLVKNSPTDPGPERERFKHRLAMSLGWTVPELNERMSAYETAQKEILEQIDPWGPKRGDYRAAVIAWVMASCFSKQTPKFKKFLKMFDFCEKYEQTEDEIDGLFNQMAGKR